MNNDINCVSDLGTLAYLVCFGAIATTIVAGFFGLGSFLLTYPDEKLIAGPDCDTRDGESGHAMSVKGV